MLRTAIQLIKGKYKEKNLVFFKTRYIIPDYQVVTTYIDNLYIIKSHV